MSAKILVSTENLPYADWLEYRRRGIGGSDASVVCGISRYKSPMELWLDKTGQLPPQEAGEAAYWGTQLEPFVRAEFAKRTGIEVQCVRLSAPVIKCKKTPRKKCRFVAERRKKR